VTDFHCGETALVEQARELRGERTIGVETFLAREESLIRLIFTNTGAEVGVVGDIRRIAQVQVDLFEEAFVPVDLDELEPDF
jgi:hypothetical protein